MKQLVCEMCGSTEMLKQDGVFVCQTCGTKYSVEEAKKMMVEGTVEIFGTVQIDNSDELENVLDLAINADVSGNREEAEFYCNRALEIEPTNSIAWLIKGKSAGWQSTLDNIRFAEAINCFANAVNYMPDIKKDEILEDCKDEIMSLSIALIQLQCDRFAKWPDKDESNGLLNITIIIFKALIQFMEQLETEVSVVSIKNEVATKINQAVVQAWQSVILPEYNGDDNLPSQYQWKEFIERIGFCTMLLEKSLELLDGENEVDIQLYENLIFLHNEAIKSTSWTPKYLDFGGYGSIQATILEADCRKNGFVADPSNDTCWIPQFCLTDEAKNIRKNLISSYNKRIGQIKQEISKREVAEKAEKERIAREEAQKRLDEYWNEHADEKATLESEQKDLNSQISAFNTSLNDQVSALNNEISRIPGKAEIDNIEARIQKLSDEKSSLGLFKGKEKKAIQEKIDQANNEKKAVQNRMDAAKKEVESKISSIKSDYQKKISPLQSRLDEISNELTKPR